MYVDQGATVPTHGTLTSIPKPPVKGHPRTRTSIPERKPSEGEYLKFWQISILWMYSFDLYVETNLVVNCYFFAVFLLCCSCDALCNFTLVKIYRCNFIEKALHP